MFIWNCRAESFGNTVVIIVPNSQQSLYDGFSQENYLLQLWSTRKAGTISRSTLQQTLLAYVPSNKKKQLTVLFSFFFSLPDEYATITS